MDFWNNFYNLCKKQGIKPTPLIKSFNMSTSCITYWKNGSLPKIEHLILLADYFNITIDELIGRDTSKLNKSDNQIIQSTNK